jgi:hypothetical protein
MRALLAACSARIPSDELEEGLTMETAVLQERLASGLCICCGNAFTDKNVHTKAGWAETRISQTCEDCFDDLFAEEDELDSDDWSDEQGRPF